MSDYLHCSTYKVRCYDTDYSGTVFFPNALKWIDSIAFTDYLENRGVKWNEVMELNRDAVVAHVSIDYENPMFLDDLLDITIEKIEVGHKSLRIYGSLYKHDGGDVIARCKIVYVFVDLKTRKSVEVPEKIRQIVS